MKLYHQTGHNEIWNIESYQKKAGQGLIFSPVNLIATKLENLDLLLKSSSFLDPQLYLIDSNKKKLATYPYFPTNIKSNFVTQDFESYNSELAKLCVDFQSKNEFEYLVIPTRYYPDNPSTFYEQSEEFFIKPFCDYVKSTASKKKLLLSVIVKNIMLTDIQKRDDLLNWITGIAEIDGVYLIFENNFTSKQIKDFEFLINALRFIKILRNNDLEVHIGYTNTEALLYSLAMPTSATMGSYENLRDFKSSRFQEQEDSKKQQPNARLYSSKLLQWIEYVYIQAMQNKIPNYETYFDESEFEPLIFTPTFQWHFMKPELYKHYFYVFDKQVKELPANQNDRIDHLSKIIRGAIQYFDEIQNDHDILLDRDSDGSHLYTWLNVINTFKNEII